MYYWRQVIYPRKSARSAGNPEEHKEIWNRVIHNMPVNLSVF